MITRARSGESSAPRWDTVSQPRRAERKRKSWRRRLLTEKTLEWQPVVDSLATVDDFCRGPIWVKSMSDLLPFLSFSSIRLHSGERLVVNGPYLGRYPALRKEFCRSLEYHLVSFWTRELLMTEHYCGTASYALKYLTLKQCLLSMFRLVCHVSEGAECCRERWCLRKMCNPH